MPNTHVRAAGDGLPKCKNIVAHILKEGVRRGGNLEDAIRHLAKTLKESMELIHGGEWFSKVDHEACFVMIAPYGDQDI